MAKIHPSAEVSKSATIGPGTIIWHQAQIREDAKIGKNCIIGKGVYIDRRVIIGDNVKIENYSSLYHKTIIENGVFIGPYVCLTNDKFPRAITPEGVLKKDHHWTPGTIIIRRGASLGAGTILLPDVEIGEFALIGAGSLVTKNIPAYALAFGAPATIKGFVCACGNILTKKVVKQKTITCKVCRKKIKLS